MASSRDSPPTTAPLLDAAHVAKLHAASDGAKWGVSVGAFRDALDASVRHAFAGRALSSSEVERYLSGLHVRDLALATACAAGQAAAWEVFVAEHQAGLRRGANALDPSGGASDLADSLFGELFGVREQHGTRQSLFRYFHGRSSLATWLRAVLAQRYVDRVRAARKMDALPGEDTLPSSLRAAPAVDAEGARFAGMLHRALTAALTALSPRDRLRLACYYVQHLTLAAIGRMLAEHEATVSRHLTRTRADLRGAVEAQLRSAHGLDAEAIDECVRAAIDDPGSLDLAQLIDVSTDADPGRKNSGGDRSKEDRSKEQETARARRI